MIPARINLPVQILELMRNLSSINELELYLHSILSVAAESTNSASASLLEYDEVTKDFYFKSMLWFQGDQVRSAHVPVQGSVAGAVFLYNKPVAIDDVSKDNRHYKKIDELAGFVTKSILGVPVAYNEKTVAVLEVFNKKEKYTEEDIFIVEVLASLAGAALHNETLEKKIQATQEEARELEQLKNEFIAIASHELRTPLGLILGHATFLKELINSPDYEEQIDTIIRNATRLKEIIENLTRVDNYETGSALLHSTKASVSRIIEDVAISFNDMAKKKNITLKTETPPGQDLLVDIDGTKIAIVLSNILKNAIAFTNENGLVIMRAEQHPDYIKVSVQDNGIGIPAKDINHIFDRFYQVESHLTRKHGGMGLGLSVSKVMIEMHGGRIWAESEEGTGSVFSFLLPVRKTQPLPQTPFKS